MRRILLKEACAGMSLAADAVNGQQMLLLKKGADPDVQDEYGETALNRAIDIALQVAPTDLSVLIGGESGTGKEFFPKIIHQYSSRKHGGYIAVNCGAIPDSLVDSELFGHEKGAFTGAHARQRGRFEVAGGATLFLDEIGELPLELQWS